MIPERYKKQGFSKVGQKKQSTRPGKKWMVLAKKGDSYKIIHGGDDSMQDYKQHGSEERRKNFWNRMGGKDSAKANDPFSPLYWHKRFGTWAFGGEPDQEQEQFNDYLASTYFPQDPTLNPNMSFVEPSSTFEVSPELKRRLKKDRKEISPIRKYDNGTLQFDETTGTGNFDFNDYFKAFNVGAQAITGIANSANDAKNRRREEELYLQALLPRPKYNYNEDGLNNLPMYAGGGQNPPKVYTDKKKFEQAQKLYNDSLSLYNAGNSALDWAKTTEGFGQLEPFSTDVKILNKGNRNDIALYKGRELPAFSDPKFPEKRLNTDNDRWGYNYSQFPIQPIGGRLMTNSDSQLYQFENFVIPYYKKPVQPVVYNSSTHPIQKMNRLKSVPYPINNTDVNLQPQGVQVPMPSIPQQQGNPIYGPGRTIIGYASGENNMHFTPALQYTGAKNNELNLQDKALLDNPEELRKYVSKLDNYQFKTGGLTNQKAFEILRAGKTKNGKPLTDAQKKFFFMMGTRKNKKAEGGYNTDGFGWVDGMDPGWGIPPDPSWQDLDPGWGIPPDPKFKNLDKGWGSNGKRKPLSDNVKQLLIKYFSKNEDDWHHNVDDIPFPEAPYDTFIGPPTYPIDPTINDTYDLLGQWDSMARPQEQQRQYTFTPLRKDINKKYIPYYKEQQATTQQQASKTPATTNPTIQPVISTTPSTKTVPATARPKTLEESNREYADIATQRLAELNKQEEARIRTTQKPRVNDRFKSNIDESRNYSVPQPIDNTKQAMDKRLINKKFKETFIDTEGHPFRVYAKRPRLEKETEAHKYLSPYFKKSELNNTVFIPEKVIDPKTGKFHPNIEKALRITGLDKLQNGGFNEGAELDLSPEEIQLLQAQGYRFEIL